MTFSCGHPMEAPNVRWVFRKAGNYAACRKCDNERRAKRRAGREEALAANGGKANRMRRIPDGPRCKCGLRLPCDHTGLEGNATARRAWV